MKSPSNENVASGLMPNRLHRKGYHPEFPKMKVSYPFEEEDELTLTFKEIIDMVAKAREVGSLESKGELTEEYIRRELKLIPVVGTIGDGHKHDQSKETPLNSFLSIGDH